ncbi:DUF2955 domain-containing protein [Dongia deserti]|uniref:DUF2955 domain-containing protein n=1 Tax=Dongia deserti TaxID=2268030 RepID=UPI0013C45D82|nr:DUF2955 domain-containing protein [Dongia deserti]
MPPDSSTLDALQKRQRKSLRIALAVALGLTIAEIQGEPFTFLAPLLAFQMLLNSRQTPSLPQALGFVVIIAAASGFALGLANTLQNRPLVYLLVLGLVVFGCFLMQLTGRGGPLPAMLLTCNVMVPVLAVVSRDLAQHFVWIMIASAGSAVLLAWLGYALFPDTPGMISIEAGREPQNQPSATIAPVRTACAYTLILMPALIHYLAVDGEVSIVVLITIVSLLSQKVDIRQRAAFGLLLGNLIGGVLASVAYYTVAMVPWLPLLFLVTLAVALALSEGATRPTPEAEIFAVAMPTFLILLGLGLTPISDGSGGAFISRFIDVGLASLYALAGVSLLLPRRCILPCQARFRG